MHIGIGVEIFLAHGVEHTQGFLRGGGIIEVNQRLAVHLAGEYGEIGSYLINIKHRFLCS